MKKFCVSAFIIEPRTKKILLVYHNKFNKWVQPGGHIEEDESPEEALIREVYEETGLKIRIIGDNFPRETDYIRPLGIQKNGNLEGEIHMDIIYAAVPRTDSIINDDDEINSICWFSRDELDEIDVFPDVRFKYCYY